MVTQMSKVRCLTLEVVINLTAQQPLSSHFWDHGGRDKRGREKVNGVDAVATVQQGIPVEKGAVDIHLITDAKQVPGHSVVLAQLDSRQITESVPINNCRTWRNEKDFNLCSSINRMQLFVGKQF